MLRRAVLLSILFVFVACAALAQSAPAPGVDLNALDRNANPCTDFFQYACGAWNALNPIPPDQSSWGRFNELAENNRRELRGLLQDAERVRPGRTTVERQVGDFYAACMNTAQVDQLGDKPLEAELNRIAAIHDRAQLMADVARLHAEGVGVMFGFGARPDFKDSNMVIGAADQGGLGLPDRDYYTKTDAKSVALRADYRRHVAKMFTLLGDSPAAAEHEAATVLSLETELARASLERAARRDPNRIYHKMTVPQLEKLAPALDWPRFFSGVGAPKVTAVNVAVPGFFTALQGELTSRPLADWKTYLRWHWVHNAAPYLSRSFVDANFAFYGRTLTGAPQMQERWKRCVRYTDEELGEALGQLYVARYFPPASKAKAQVMVQDLERSLEADITNLPWMTEATKRQATIKLHAIVNKIGYPKKWRDYSSIRLARNDFFGDVLRADAFEVHRRLSFIGKPPDKGEFGMTPPTVNAYYLPPRNEIVFPAGILQPPFFSAQAPDAANFGGMGVVIGHELTHGFDDEGRKFDASGNLRDWWTAADAKAFEQRTQCIVNEYGGFSPVPGVYLNGRLTLGENTADNGGLRISYAALESALGPDGMARSVDGFTMAQLFYVAYGQIWCQNVRPEMSRMLATVDPHSPGRFRVNGAVQNDPNFAAAFHCGENTPMNPGPKACRVW
ncbi:MAG: M13 family metallopeptidase [Terriglobales bacterium]